MNNMTLCEAVVMHAGLCKRQTKPTSRAVPPRHASFVLNCHHEPVSLHQSEVINERFEFPVNPRNCPAGRSSVRSMNESVTGSRTCAIFSDKPYLTIVASLSNSGRKATPSSRLALRFTRIDFSPGDLAASLRLLRD